jgi:putative hemolysin
MSTKFFQTKVKMKFSILLLLTTVISVLIAISLGPALALRDPAQVYCEALGYTYTIEETEEGQRGFCQLPNGQAVDAGEFLQGKVAQEYSYCQQMGYEIRTVKDRETCFTFRTEECAVCVLEDGTEVEVTELMGLTFWAGPRWEVANLSISPSTVRAGQDVTVTVEVTNIGEVEGSHTVTLRLDGQVEGSRELMLDPGASESVAFTVTRDVPGTYSVHIGGLRGEFTVVGPQWEIANLSISPSTVEAGKSVSISVDTTNIGEVGGSVTVSLRIEGEVEESRELMLDPGASESVAFTVTRDVPGTYGVDIEGLTGEFTVVAPPFPWVLVWGIIAGVLAAVIVYLLIRGRRRPAA